MKDMPEKIYIDWPPNRSGFVVGCIAPFNAVEFEYINAAKTRERLEEELSVLDIWNDNLYWSCSDVMRVINKVLEDE